MTSEKFNTLKKHLALVSPLYWPAWLGLGILWLITRLPDQAQMSIGKSLGHFIWLCGGKLKTITRTNLSLCFPTWTTQERESLAKKNFQSLGIGLIEAARAWWLPNQKLAPTVTLKGLEHAEAAFAKGKGIILVSPHFTCLELVGKLIGMQYDFGVMYRPHKKALISFIHERFRKKNYREYIPRQNIRQLLRVLSQNMAVWIAYDIDAGRSRKKTAKTAVFAPFFGIQTASLTSISRLAQLSQATILPIHFCRTGNTFHYTVTLEPALTPFPTDTLEKDATLLNAALEKAIRLNPEQYIWQYKRFKTRPPGEPRLYD